LRKIPDDGTFNVPKHAGKLIMCEGYI